MLLCFASLPVLALAAAVLGALRGRWRPAYIVVAISVPLTGLALLGAASLWSQDLRWLTPVAWAPALVLAVSFGVACAVAFRRASAESYDLDRRDRLERCAGSLLGATLLEVAFLALLVVAPLVAGSAEAAL